MECGHFFRERLAIGGRLEIFVKFSKGLCILFRERLAIGGRLEIFCHVWEGVAYTLS